MNATASFPEIPADAGAKAKKCGIYLLGLTGCLFGAVLLITIALNPFHRGHFVSGKEFLNGSAIAEALDQYAALNGTDFKVRSSTELFQKLVDRKLITDPAVFYLPFPGKSPAANGQPLKPENVGWDATTPYPDLRSQIPVIFVTGCKVNYAPGGSAVALGSSLPGFLDEHLSLFQEWNHDAMVSCDGDLIAIHRFGGGDGFPLGADRTVAHFISPDIDLHGRTYRQLTPDGTLP